MLRVELDMELELNSGHLIMPRQLRFDGFVRVRACNVRVTNYL